MWSSLVDSDASRSPVAAPLFRNVLRWGKGQRRPLVWRYQPLVRRERIGSEKGPRLCSDLDYGRGLKHVVDSVLVRTPQLELARRSSNISGGRSAVRPNTRCTNGGRAFYARQDTGEPSLEEPSEGVKDEVDFAQAYAHLLGKKEVTEQGLLNPAPRKNCTPGKKEQRRWKSRRRA